jgi:hypothetical protein
MEKLVLILFCYISFFSSSQTKQETQDWLKEKIKIYGYNNPDNVQHNYTVSFVDSNLIISDYYGMYGIFVLNTMSIPIRKIKIRFEEKIGTIWMVISTSDGSNSIKMISETKTEYVNENEVIFDKSIKLEDLPNRLVKSFNHLITLYGGKVVKEAF